MDGQRMFEVLGRVTIDGVVMTGPHQLVPLADAIAWGVADKDGKPLPFDYDDKKAPVVEHKVKAAKPADK